MRLTYATVLLARAIADDPTGRHWGYDLSKKTGLRSGVLYPILQRMFDAGMVSDGWEARKDTGGKRPPRRYYKLTRAGTVELNEMLARAESQMRFDSLGLRSP